MTLHEAVIAGVIQGIAEFLPISSSAHLVLLHHYFGHKEAQLLFDIFLHIGSLLAICVYFRKDIIAIFKKEKKLLLLVIIGCIPTGVIGVLFKSFFKQAFVNIKLVGAMLLLNAFLLFSADLVTRLRKKEWSGLKFWKALVIGTAQGAAILPGLSRSGVTISAALLSNVKKMDAIKYSFLLAIPAILGALAFELKDVGSFSGISVGGTITGTLIAFLVGLVAIYCLIKSLLKDKLFLFGIYCFIIGSIALVLK